MKRLPSCALLVIAITSSVAHAENNMFYMGGELHHWAEHNGGRQILSEDGLLMSVGLLSFMRPERRWDGQASVSLFFGALGYDGENLRGDPVKSESSYFGERFEWDEHLALARSEDAALRLYGGLGGSQWWRTIASRPIAQGYTESWFELYAQVGLSAVQRLGGGRLQAQVGLELPFHVANDVDFTDLGGDQITVHPNGRVGLFAAVTFVRKGDLSFGAAYQAERFGQSESQGGLGQPDSSSDMFTVRLGGAF